MPLNFQETKIGYLGRQGAEEIVRTTKTLAKMAFDGHL